MSGIHTRHPVAIVDIFCAISLPLPVSGFPVGLMLVACQRQDRRLLRMAADTKVGDMIRVKIEKADACDLRGTAV